jgi:hypothetical protein
MQNNTKEFLGKLHDLMLEYGVEVEVNESCHGYGIDCIEFTVPYTAFFGDGDSYNSCDYCEFHGRYLDAQTIKEKLDAAD